MGQRKPLDGPAVSPVSALDFVKSLTPVPDPPSDQPTLTIPTLDEPSLRHPERPADVLESLSDKGHQLSARHGMLLVDSPDGVPLTDDERVALHRLKPHLIEFLERRQASPTVDPNWQPDEIPNVDDIDELVLNFATNGLDWRHGDRPIGVTISTLDQQLVRFLPFGFCEGNLDEEAVKYWLSRFRNKKLYNANTRFDVHQSREWGVDLTEHNTFSDIMHTAALLDDHRKQFALDVLARDYLPDVPMVARLDETQHANYAAGAVAEREKHTALTVARLHDVMYPLLDAQELRPVQALEDRVIPCVVEMEKNGAPIDVELLDQYYLECNRRHDALLLEISKEVGFAFDHKPTAWRRLFETLKLPRTDSYAEHILQGIDHPIVQKAYRASQFASLNSKIFKSYKEKVEDGYLYFDINQLRGEEGGTVTGRFSAGIIQQVPNAGNHFAVFGDDLFPRRLYIAGEGQYLAADAAQIQYRIFAHYAANERIKAMYADNPKASFHRMIEKIIRPYKPDLIYEHVKNMNFMRIFGGKLIKTAVMMGFISEAVGREIREAQTIRTDPRLAPAREIDDIYKRELPEVEPLLKLASHLAMTRCNDYCRPGDTLHRQYAHRGYVRTILGRRSRFPYDDRLHKAFCMIDQGSEGDIVKTKIAELYESRKETGFRMRMTVHDEITGDALADDTLAKVDTILNHQSFPQLTIPILWECGQGPTWADAKHR